MKLCVPLSKRCASIAFLDLAGQHKSHHMVFCAGTSTARLIHANAARNGMLCPAAEDLNGDRAAAAYPGVITAVFFGSLERAAMSIKISTSGPLLYRARVDALVSAAEEIRRRALKAGEPGLRWRPGQFCRRPSAPGRSRAPVPSKVDRHR